MNEIERGRKMLREYLNQKSGDMSVTTKRKLFGILEKNYLDHMNADPCYYEKISTFLNQRKPRAIREAFCYDMVRELIKFQDPKEEYKRLYPEDF